MSEQFSMPVSGDGLEKRLIGYALAAGATLLVSTQPAQAGSIQVTPCGTDGKTICGNSGMIYIDLLTGINDAAHAQFQIFVSSSFRFNPEGIKAASGSTSGYARLMLAGVGAGKRAVAVTSSSGYTFAAAFPSRDAAKAATYFSCIGKGIALASVSYSSGSAFGYGPWLNKHGFLALKFNVGGTDYQGWAELTTSFNSGVQQTSLRAAQINGFDATLGDNGVIDSAVPEPGSLALLALGVAGLGAFRRRRKAPQN